MESRRLIALLDELKEQGYELPVEDVIYHSLISFRNSLESTEWEKLISGALTEHMSGKNVNYKIMNQDKIIEFLKEG